MKKSDFYYDLPKERIAQTPIEPRDASRMLVIDRKTDVIEDKHFYDIVDYLEAGDCLILYDTKVLPARLYGIKEDTGAHVEFLLLTQKEKDLCKQEIILENQGWRMLPPVFFCDQSRYYARKRCL